MTDQQTDNLNSTPSPDIRTRSGPSLVWLIPVITLLIGGWLIVKTLSEKGPEVTISFKTAEGIEAGKTKIKYKNVDIGVVDTINFSEDFSSVLLTASFEQGTESFLRRETRFWVVKPRLSLRGASGLETLVSGAYIEIEPGQGVARRHFVGLEKPPVVKASEAGKKIILISSKLGSIDTGSQIYYQGITAGEVLGYELANDRKSVYIYAFIKSPMDELIRSNTRFWNVSGMDVSLDTDGLSMRTESIQSMLYGGIAFETPSSREAATEEVDTLIFTLYDSYESIQEFAYTHKIKFVMFFDSSVRGLNIGAPVEFKGIKIGSVTDVRLEFDSHDTSFRIPVVVEIEPERIIDKGNKESISPYETLNKLVDKGLRAELSTGSLLTGQLYVKLDMHPDTPIQLSDNETSLPELPTVPGGLDALASTLSGFATKLETVQIDKIGEELLDTLQGANKLLNAPELHAAARDLKGTIISLKSILKKVDESNLGEAIDSANIALEKINKTMTLMNNNILTPDSPIQYSIIEMTSELEETARSIRALVDMLERNPNSIIFGK
ncbi:MAG: MCE family protein [Gammaproteobacteria bacterium]|nr:MAG: MCE family protein [Gammaproteobacteria bacterium]